MSKSSFEFDGHPFLKASQVGDLYGDSGALEESRYFSLSEVKQFASGSVIGL